MAPSGRHTAPRCSNSCKPHGVAFSGYCSLLRPLDLGGEAVKIHLNDERDRQLLVVVLKEDFVLTLFRHLHPHGCLAYPTTVGSVGFQQILPCVAVQAALAEVLALLVLALVIEKTVEVLDPGVVKFAGLFNQQHVDPLYLLWLLAKAVDSDALVPTEYTDGQVILLLHFWDLRDGRGGIDPFDVEVVIGRILRRSVYMVTGWEQGQSECPSEAVVILVFHIDNCLLRPCGCWKWDVKAPSQWLISCDVQPEGLHSVNVHPDPLCVHFSSSSKRWGMASSRAPLILLAWRKAFCLWQFTGAVNSSVPSGPCLRRDTCRAS